MKLEAAPIAGRVVTPAELPKLSEDERNHEADTIEMVDFSRFTNGNRPPIGCRQRAAAE